MTRCLWKGFEISESGDDLVDTVVVLPRNQEADSGVATIKAVSVIISVSFLGLSF